MEKVRGQNHTIAAAFTRPADTNAYAAGDVVNNSTSAPLVLTFNRAALDGDASAGGYGSGGIIQHAEIVGNANQATKPDLELWLFDTAPSIPNDNAAFAPSFAEMKTVIGVIAFPVASFKVGNATVGAGGAVICEASNIGLPFNVVGTNNAAIFGILVVRNAYTPTSGEQYQIRLHPLD